MRRAVVLCLTCCLVACTTGPFAERGSVRQGASDLCFEQLATRWDEGIPLGNGTLGQLVWKKDSSLRFSLDHTDLWDLRPTDSFAGATFRFAWVKEHIRSGDYLPVQQKLDWPYNNEPAPSKIPGGALEFGLASVGEPIKVHLSLADATCQLDWASGLRLQTFVHATEPVGWFRWSEAQDPALLPLPRIVPPPYHTGSLQTASPVSGQDLRRLGYDPGFVDTLLLTGKRGRMCYHQPGYGDFAYEIWVEWERTDDGLVGCWSLGPVDKPYAGQQVLSEAARQGWKRSWKQHRTYWQTYWDRTSVSLPDSLLQRQYDNEMYKFGSVARADAAPISLQAVWTADNGKLPPWKGDFHHDLNTQLSYWPAYAGNRLSEGLGYLNTLWEQQQVYRHYTRTYFEAPGLNVPGVCTRSGEPMGGWIQYAMSQTVSAWMSQHFYLHWQYSRDTVFLRERAWPFIRESARFLEAVSYVDEHGYRRLEFSSSPEIFDNSIQAWFKDMTNFDLSLMHFVFEKTAELAQELSLPHEVEHWQALAAQLPDLDLDPQGGLTFAPGYEYDASHRHFSHALAIHPLGLLDWDGGEQQRRVIRQTLEDLIHYGPDYWTGYSYAWFANLAARARRGDLAEEALRTFAACFCLPNTFHVNGDQSGTGKSRLTYRPFTLEGNFAFAAAVHEMLIQSHTGVVRLFPAIPAHWTHVSFERLRTRGAFLVSAVMTDGQLSRLVVESEAGGELVLKAPEGQLIDGKDTLRMQFQPGEIKRIL